MSNHSENSTPWTFSQWQMQQSYADVHGASESAYIQYLKQWYNNKNQHSSKAKEALKQEFIQLIKDLNFIFAQNETNLFIKDIDYNNQEDLILAIPFFAKKLTEVAKVLNSKRESVKRAKNKFNLIGSNKGLESLLYDYVLRTFTQRDGLVTQIPALPIQTMFPELSSIKNDFFIELEELHDVANYHDSDPSVDVKEYLDYSHIEDFLPLKDDVNPFSEKEILGMISTRFLDRVSDTPLSNIFKDYLSNVTSNPSLSSQTSQINNQIAISQKFLGETLYGLTAVKLEEVAQPDFILNVGMAQGDNWFLWPSGYQELKHNVYNNSYSPINIQESSFIQSGATPGSTYTNSDLLFSDKNGTVEGAWLQGPYSLPVNGRTNIILKGGEVTEFLYPFVGYDLDTREMIFKNFNLERNNDKFFKALTTEQQVDILTKYYTTNFPLTASLPIYLNQSTLIDRGATAGKFSDEADVIIKRTHDYTTPEIHSGIDTEISFVYKFDRTDLAIIKGTNNIQWPVQTFTTGDTLPTNFTENDCLPIRLSEVNSSYAMAGAVAGQTISTSDVIYKLNSRGDVTQATEAAWYGSEPVSHLNITTQNIMIYGQMSAVECSHFVDGSIQSSISFKANANEKISFIWCGEDTFADEVFKYINHEKNCVYGKTYPHEYYKDQDFVNPVSLSNKNYWTQCSCKAVHYSPIGHKGNKVTDYNGTADYLFADPFGLGDKFTIGSWVDTRGLNIKDSPQFSFFQLDQTEGDGNIGFGTGRWKTSDTTLSEVGDRMILKTGRRYTYCRSGLRTNSSSGAGNTISAKSSPYFVCNYIYPKLNAIMCDGNDVKYDIVIALDYSRSQSFDFDKVKKAVNTICSKLINACTNDGSNVCYDRQKSVQVAIVGFAANSVMVNYLTNEEYELNLQIEALNCPTQFPDYQTNFSAALRLCDNILNPTSPGLDKTLLDLKTLCSSLNVTLANQSKLSGALNSPQKGAIQKIVIISDGVSTTEDSADIVSLAKQYKNKGIEIQAISMGELSLTNSLMEQIATSDQTHFNLYKYLVSGDGNYDSFISYISTRINGCVPFYPVWRKAIKNQSGNWIETTLVSDIILRPNDYLIYEHQGGTSYIDTFAGVEFYQPGVSFTINIKLDGWDYEMSNFSNLNVGPSFGAKPFWAKVPTNPVVYAGQIKFVYDYVPLHQPDISVMSLNTGDYVQYNRIGALDLGWDQPLNFDVTINTVQWNKIIFDKKYSNLESILRSNKLDCIIQGSTELSDILLEGYSEYKPARYHYYAVNSFSYSENLYLKNRCISNYIIFNSGVFIEPAEPYANLDNRFFPTAATVSFPNLAVTENEVGGYMLPENLGVSTYRGRGYSYSVNQTNLSAISLSNSEAVFLDPKKYGSRNRGLTKKDQLSPVVLDGIDNKWIMEPYGSGAKAGVILGTKENQKFTPYQSDYEILGYNTHGLARQQDDFQFWKFNEDNNVIWKDKTSDSNYRKELLSDVYGTHVNKLLANKGTMVQWRCDIFGNDYGLYKQLQTEVIHIKKLPPTIIFQTASALSINVGSFCALSIIASGEQPFSYQWYHNNTPIVGGAFTDYKIFKSVPETSGVYVCQVSNLMGMVSSVPIYITFNIDTEGNFIVDDLEDILTGDDQKPIAWI